MPGAVTSALQGGALLFVMITHVVSTIIFSISQLWKQAYYVLSIHLLKLFSWFSPSTLNLTNDLKDHYTPYSSV